jgi:hypothetical protein
MNRKLLFAGLFLLGGALSARAQEGGVRVWVPFSFEVANQTLPSGEYVLWSERSEVFVRVANGKTVAMISSNRTTHDGGKFGKVVFHCYENRCFLSGLWTPDAEKGREILTSRVEREVPKQKRPQQFALQVVGGKQEGSD